MREASFHWPQFLLACFARTYNKRYIVVIGRIADESHEILGSFFPQNFAPQILKFCSCCNRPHSEWRRICLKVRQVMSKNSSSYQYAKSTTTKQLSALLRAMLAFKVWIYMMLRMFLWIFDENLRHCKSVLFRKPKYWLKKTFQTPKAGIKG